MVPHDPASLGSQAICVQSLQSGPQRPLSQHAVSNVFPTPASRDEGAFLPMPGVGLHDVAMGDQRSAPIRAAQGIAPVGAAQGILRLGRYALHFHRAVMDCALRGARPMPIFRHCLGGRRVNAISQGRCRGRIAATITQFSAENDRIPCRKRWNADHKMPSISRAVCVAEYGK
jgi:hypothetical protein